MSKMIRVLIADKHSLVKAGIRATLAAEEDVKLVGEASNGSEVQRLTQELKPDVLLLSSNITDSTPTEILTCVRAHCSEVKVLVLTIFDELYSHNLVAAGVAGCVLKDEKTETLVSAIRTVAQGNTWFSQPILEKLVQPQEPPLNCREQEILTMIAKGWDNARIAAEIRLAEQTVRNYISRIYDKLEVNSRSKAVVWAREHNFGRTSKDIVSP